MKQINAKGCPHDAEYSALDFLVIVCVYVVTGRD